MKPEKYSKLTREQRAELRKRYASYQNNKCCYCGASLSGPPTDGILKKRISRDLFPKHFFDYPTHLHHNHDTDLTIGAVHAYCNAVLWEHHGE